MYRIPGQRSFHHPLAGGSEPALRSAIENDPRILQVLAHQIGSGIAEELIQTLGQDHGRSGAIEDGKRLFANFDVVVRTNIPFRIGQFGRYVGIRKTGTNGVKPQTGGQHLASLHGAS